MVAKLAAPSCRGVQLTRCYVTDIREYHDVLNCPHQEITLHAIKDARLENNRVGAELGQGRVWEYLWRSRS